MFFKGNTGVFDIFNFKPTKNIFHDLLMYVACTLMLFVYVPLSGIYSAEIGGHDFVTYYIKTALI